MYNHYIINDVPKLVLYVFSKMHGANRTGKYSLHMTKIKKYLEISQVFIKIRLLKDRKSSNYWKNLKVFKLQNRRP